MKKPLSTLLLSATVLAPTLLCGSLAAAQPIGGEPPTLGVRTHSPTAAGVDDAASADANPAALGLLPGWSLRLHHTEVRSASRMAGRGTGLFFSSPIFGRSSFGFSTQWLRPSDAIGYADHVKVGLSYALRLSSWAAFGIGYSWFYSDGDAAIDSLDSWQLGLLFRPYSWLGLGLGVRNVNTPKYDGLPLQREYDVDLTLRPLTTRRLEFGIGATVGERRGDVDPRARLVIEPLQGLQLFGHTELLRRDFYRDGDERWDVRATVGMRLLFERSAFAASTLLGRQMPNGVGAMGRSGTRSAFQGVSVSAALHGVRRPPLVEPARRLLTLRLDRRLDTPTMVWLERTLQRVEDIPSLAGVLLLIERAPSGWAKVQELRGWLASVRRRGKKVYAYLRAGGLRSYYLASAANHIMLDPAGGLRISGLSHTSVYLRGFFDKVGLNPQFIHIAEYKTAPETLTQKGPSKYAQEVRKELIDGLYGQALADISKSRGIEKKKLATIFETGPLVPPMALSSKLIDEIVPKQELKERVQKHARARLVSPAAATRRHPAWPERSTIAVVAIDGDIVMGKSRTIPLLGRRVVGDKTIVKTLDRLRRQSSVKAVVLRIDSPGGSALASDHMWRAARALAKAKPLVVSMSSLAASGGYYAAAAGHTIYAMPATITGSIGIFSGKLDHSGLYQKLGISTSNYKRGEHADMESSARPYSTKEEATILKRLRYFYDEFKRAVAAGRKLTVAQVEAVAKGRVWLGDEAKRRGLVSRLGGLRAAIADAKARAGIRSNKRVSLVVLPKGRRTLLSRLMQQTRANTSVHNVLPRITKDLLRHIPPALWDAQAHEPMARLPLMLHIP